MMWLQSIWHFVFGWPTVDVLVGCAAIAVAVLEPPIIATLIPDLRKWAVCTAVLAFTFLSISGKYYHDGLAEKQNQWDAAVIQEAANGEKARQDAARAVDTVSSDRRLFDHDARNRDSGKQRTSK